MCQVEGKGCTRHSAYRYGRSPSSQPCLPRFVLVLGGAGPKGACANAPRGSSLCSSRRLGQASSSRRLGQTSSSRRLGRTFTSTQGPPIDLPCAPPEETTPWHAYSA